MSKIRRSTELVMMASSVSPPIRQSVHNFTWIPPEQKDSTQKLWTFRNRYIQLKFSEYYLRSTKFSNTIYIGPHIKINGFYAESTPTLNVLKKNIQLSKSVHYCVPIGWCPNSQVEIKCPQPYLPKSWVAIMYKCCNKDQQHVACGLCSYIWMPIPVSISCCVKFREKIKVLTKPKLLQRLGANQMVLAMRLNQSFTKQSVRQILMPAYD